MFCLLYVLCFGPVTFCPLGRFVPGTLGLGTVIIDYCGKVRVGTSYLHDKAGKKVSFPVWQLKRLILQKIDSQQMSFCLWFHKNIASQ